MSCEVYANKMEVSCKVSDGKSICAFPDVCMTPPQTAATPPGVPIPYPNTGAASDCTDGSTTVTIGGAQVMLKDKSYFKKSTGDEAGNAPKKGVITGQITGKVYFCSWSMDVMVEGENVVRHLDLTTHNHASSPGNVGPQIYQARMTLADIPGCAGQINKIRPKCEPPEDKAKCPDSSKLDAAKADREAAKKAFGDKSPQHLAAVANWNNEMDAFSAKVEADPCQQAMRCLLSPQIPSKCCPGQTPHHLVEASSFFDKGRKGKGFVVDTKNTNLTDFTGRNLVGTENYKANLAPCICVEGENQGQATHRLMHLAQNDLTSMAPTCPPPLGALPQDGPFQTLETAQKNGATAVTEVFPDSECDADCIEAQLNKYHYGDSGAKMGPAQSIRKVIV